MESFIYADFWIMYLFPSNSLYPFYKKKQLKTIKQFRSCDRGSGANLWLIYCEISYLNIKYPI